MSSSDTPLPRPRGRCSSALRARISFVLVQCRARRRVFAIAYRIRAALLCCYHALRLAVSVAPFRCPFALLFMRCLRLWYLLSTRRVSYASSVPPCFYRSFVTPGALPISFFYFRREYACLLLKVADGCSATTEA